METRVLYPMVPTGPIGVPEFADAATFCILNVLGDVLDDGELHFVEAARTLEGATRRVKALAELCPGQYVIYDEQTGERVSIIAGAERRTLLLKARFGKNIHGTI